MVLSIIVIITREVRTWVSVLSWAGGCAGTGDRAHRGLVLGPMGPDPASVSLWTLDAHGFFPSWRRLSRHLLLGQGLAC